MRPGVIVASGRSSLPVSSVLTDAGLMLTDRLTILDSDACWSMLQQAEVGRLAVSLDGDLEIFPVNFVVDNRTVVFRTAAGTKLAGAVLGRSVASRRGR